MPSYSLRTLMIVVTLVAVGCGFISLAFSDKFPHVILMWGCAALSLALATEARKAETSRDRFVGGALSALLALLVVGLLCAVMG